MNPQLIVRPPEAGSESQSAGGFRLRGPWLNLARATWILISLIAVTMLIVGLIANTVWYWTYTQADCHDAAHLANNLSELCLARYQAYVQVFGSLHLFAVYSVVGESVEMLPWILIGVLIFWRKSRDPFALLFSLGMLLVGVLIIDRTAENMIDLFYPAFSPLWLALYFLGSVLLVLWYGFPDGQFVPRAMRWIVLPWIALEVGTSFLSGTPLDYSSWPAPLPQVIGTAFTLSLVASLLHRYRRFSGTVQRQQIRWVVFPGAIFGFLYVGNFAWQWAELLWRPINFALINAILDAVYLPLLYLGSAFFAVGIGISILRYHLWNIDILINRALVYGSLTALVVGVYALVVGALGAAVQSNLNWLLSIVATGLIAVSVQPVRDRLQRGVNRLMYGERDDPITVLSRLGQRLEIALAPNAVLPSLVETVGQTLKLPYVAIELAIGEGLWPRATADSSLIAYGRPQSDVIRLPLVNQSETVGQLLVAPRAPGEAFSPLDLHLLENIARQAGMAVHALSLTKELQLAHQHLVGVVEEERRRLRRDLHDGLGPALASQGLKLAAAKQFLDHDPDSARPLLDEVMAQIQETVGNVRSLVSGLRPPALDERGLAEAIRDHMVHGQNHGLQVEVGELPAGVLPLPAAVEVAAYRITLEALTNVIRHARAQHCMVQFAPNGNGRTHALRIEIVDDGLGLPRELHAGVGLRSMRGRAEELGGTLTVEPGPRGGTRILAILPLSEGVSSMDSSD